MSRYESPEVEAMMRRMFRGLVRRAAEGDTEALEALAALENVAGVALTVGLAKAHHSGGGLYSHGELCQVLGTSRQAVRQRIGRLEGLRGEAATLAGWLATSARPGSWTASRSRPWYSGG